jgi:bacteriocin biosynthesis cyclodehydratase domain-containing protein
LPFTVLSSPGRVRLVAGEDYRFTLSAPEIESWLPAWLPMLDGSRTLEDAIAVLAPAHAEAAKQVLARLLSERVLIDGPLVKQEAGGPDVRVLSQDSLRFAEAEQFNADCLKGDAPWMWATTGPMGRGYVSPVFLPQDGPCLVCLLRHFRRLSPLPSLYDELAAHERGGGTVPPVPFPEEGAVILAQLVNWKARLVQRGESNPAVFRLHVLEAATMCVTSHEVMVDPECPACRGRR